MSFLVVRIVKQVQYDKRLLGLLFGAPLLVLTLLRLLLGPSDYVPKIGVSMPQPFVSALQAQRSAVSAVDVNKVDDLLKSRTIDAAVYLEGGAVAVRMLEDDPFKTSLVVAVIQKAAAALAPAGAGGVRVEFIYGKSGSSMFDSVAYVLLGTIAFFFVFILAGIAFTRERSQGTLERLIMSPIKRWQIIGGYTAAYGLLAAVQSTVVLLYGNFVLDIRIGTAMPLAVLIMVLMSVTAVSVGILVSTAARNEFQVVQFIPVLVLPQVFLSGLIPVDSIPYNLGVLSYVMPLYYACEAMKRVIVYGSGLEAIWRDLGILVGLSLVMAAISTGILKQYRKI